MGERKTDEYRIYLVDLSLICDLDYNDLAKAHLGLSRYTLCGWTLELLIVLLSWIVKNKILSPRFLENLINTSF